MLDPDIQELYRDFLEKPNSQKAHKLLHTHYRSRKPIKIKFITKHTMKRGVCFVSL